MVLNYVEPDQSVLFGWIRFGLPALHPRELTPFLVNEKGLVSLSLSLEEFVSPMIQEPLS